MGKKIFSEKSALFYILIFNKTHLTANKFERKNEIKWCFALKKTFFEFYPVEILLNKFSFLFFGGGMVCCTFVSSKKANGGAARESGKLWYTDSETFHEIIYGKPTRRKRAPGFFLPVCLKPCLGISYRIRCMLRVVSFVKPWCPLWLIFLPRRTPRFHKGHNA